MTIQEKAKELVEVFGDKAALVVDQLLLRDKQWIDKLSEEYPDQWVNDDYGKSVKMMEEVREEIMKL